MSDGAGIVEAVGDGVSEFKVGDHVVSCFFPNWLEGPPPIADFSTVPGDGVDGYAREIVVAPATAFTNMPKQYSFAEGATLTTAGVTAWRALVVNGALKAGENVLVLARAVFPFSRCKSLRLWELLSLRRLPPTRSWSGFAPLEQIILSTTVIIRIGVLAFWSGRVALAWTTLSKWEGPALLPNP